ncbi:LpqB family beta-propeller domain-containing protein [Streptomyces sp. NBC_01387]|uniref:LpqB family beta-propeller domain-containing protein n=1 Tax=unclassified Streptomyces TaxID=2593676 RepID=UPI0020247118|nr:MULTISPECIES: LpqB family beta-propeller domain-containing protein [unclassified Streptomyces]MCX4550735.1 LpqB family beta-propeller domain-containing protein [Streptomyces sp. NBC_01500]WSC24720.1 LpqB family beta-propeller domain-containing protein [Streptomyces sp. NBC_01766]
MYVWLGCGGVLLAGCASMPNSGDIEAVDPSQRNDSQVKVYAVPPKEGAAPAEIVDGFLEAMTSDDLQFATARKYLTKGASRSWDPGARTTVLADGPTRRLSPANDRDAPEGSSTFELTGTEVAVVDKQHAYRPDNGKYRNAIHLVRQNGKEWRIDDLPAGLLLSLSDFQRNYHSVNKYYFASAPTSGTPGQDWLVADPVYLRQGIDPETRMDPLTQTVASLLDGPTNWLRPVVGSRFPAGTALKKGVKTLALDDRNALTVPLNDKAKNVGQGQCRMMAAQLLFTLRDTTSMRVDQVELERADGSQLCVLSADHAEEYAPDRTSGTPAGEYFVDAKGRLVEMQVTGGGTSGRTDPEPVQGPLGTGEKPLSTVAVARDEHRAAGVSKDGGTLYTSSIVSGREAPELLYSSHAKQEKDRLSAPSWDGRGDLWVADRDPSHPRLLRFAGGSGEPQNVPLVGLDGARIEGLRMSSDGVRIALLLFKDGHTTLKVGRVVRHGTADNPTVPAVEALRPAAPQMADVTAVSWAGRSRLVVVGKEAGGVQQVRYMQADGSVSSVNPLPGANRITAVAASDDDRLPLMALSDEDGIVRMPPRSNWKTVVTEGKSPVYPG